MSQGIDRPASASSPSAVDAPHRGGENVLRACSILLVDDSADDRQMILSYLRRFNVGQEFTILEASGIEEGLRLLKQVRISLVLLDHALPDGTGNEFIARALADTDGRRLPIIMLTGRGSEHVAVDAMRKGASDYLSKGELGPDMLYRAIVRAQKMRELAEELAESSHARNVAQMALHHNEVTLQRLIESIKDYAILSLDAYGHVLSWNLGARTMFDYHDQDVIGAHLRHFMDDNAGSANDAKGDLDRAVRDGSAHGHRYFRRRDGSLFEGSSTLSPICAATGQLLGFAWVVHVPPASPVTAPTAPRGPAPAPAPGASPAGGT